MHEHYGKPRSIRQLEIALVITVSFLVIEFIGAILTNSLALLTDSLHMLNDTFALVFALIAAWVAQRPISMKRTYGYYRAEVLAAFLNGIFLWGVVAFIFYEAFQRIMQPAQVQSLNMLIIAVLGLAANTLSALTLSKSKDESLNVKGAFLHVLADALGSVGAILAGLIMFFTGWYQADPLLSMAIAALIFHNSTKLIRESLNVLLEGVPPGIDLESLQRRIVEVKGVDDVHDLHAWCISPNNGCIVSAHVVVEKGVDKRQLTTNLIKILEEEFGIAHPTIQLEDEDYPKAIGEH